MKQFSSHIIPLLVLCAALAAQFCGCYYEGYWQQARILKSSNDLLELRAILVNEFTPLKHHAQEPLLRRFSERCRTMVEQAERDMDNGNSAGEAGERRAAWDALAEESESILKAYNAQLKYLRAREEMEVKAGTAFDLFRAQKGTLPLSLNDLNAAVADCGMGELNSLDPWNVPYQFLVSGEGQPSSIRMISYGPDGAQGGGDDLEVELWPGRSSAN